MSDKERIALWSRCVGWLSEKRGGAVQRRLFRCNPEKPCCMSDRACDHILYSGFNHSYLIALFSCCARLLATVVLDRLPLDDTGESAPDDVGAYLHVRHLLKWRSILTMCLESHGGRDFYQRGAEECPVIFSSAAAAVETNRTLLQVTARSASRTQACSRGI